jgi:hypothetical protein
MTSRLALCAAVAAIVLLAPHVGASAQTYEVTPLVPGSAFHGVHGLGIDKAGRLFAGSVAGAALYEVDRNNGAAKIAIPSPEGMADDIAFAPDGTMAWTGFLTGDFYSRKGDGPIKKLASGLPGINSLAYRRDGRLYATQVFLGDALYEIDVEGVKPPRMIMEKMGGLNGFEFGPDDKLYGPLWFKGQVGKVDVDKAELTAVADGFKIPAAVNFDSKAICGWSTPRSANWCGSIRKPARRRWSPSSSPRSITLRSMTRIASSSPTWPTTESRRSMPRPAPPSR